MTLLTGLLAERKDDPAPLGSTEERGSWSDGFQASDAFEGQVLDPQSLHKYLYCNDDPVNLIDPSGMLGISLGMAIRIAAWTTVAVLATYVAWSYLGPDSFARWGHGTSWSAGWSGPAEIDNYKNSHLAALQGTYKDANLNDIFFHYGLIYPRVVSRKCDTALEQLMAELRPVVQDEPNMRKGMKFISGLINTTNPEPDNILILVPDEYDDLNLAANLADPAWYNNDAKRNITFFYVGSVPFAPVGNLYDAVTDPDSPYGEFISLEVYNVPEESF